MQLFIAELSNLIDQGEFEKSWHRGTVDPFLKVVLWGSDFTRLRDANPDSTAGRERLDPGGRFSALPCQHAQ